LFLPSPFATSDIDQVGAALHVQGNELSISFVLVPLARTAAVLFAIGWLAQAAEAALMFGTPANATTSGGTVSALAEITVNNGSIEIVLTNLTENPGNAAQLLSAITFNASAASGSGALTTLNSGSVSTISASGTYTSGVSDALARWKASETGTTISVTTLSGGNPDRLIIGPDDAGNLDPTLGGLYSGVNASVIGDNPSVLGSATFTVTVPGLNTSSAISNVVFQFGTTTGSNLVSGENTLVANAPPIAHNPEPATLAIWGLGAVGCAIYGVRRHKRSARTSAR